MQLTEKECLIELKKGSFSAFDHIFSLYKERLYAFSIGYLKVPEDAQELVQIVFMKVWENRKMLDESKSFSSYLFTISKNTILNYIRKKANQQSYVDYLLNQSNLTYNDAEGELEYEDLLKQTNTAIDQLPFRQKEIYHLSREVGLSNEEIAQKLNISKKTVENHITLVMKFIRQHIGYDKMSRLLFISLFL